MASGAEASSRPLSVISRSRPDVLRVTSAIGQRLRCIMRYSVRWREVQFVRLAFVGSIAFSPYLGGDAVACRNCYIPRSRSRSASLATGRRARGSLLQVVRKSLYSARARECC